MKNYSLLSHQEKCKSNTLKSYMESHVYNHGNRWICMSFVPEEEKKNKKRLNITTLRFYLTLFRMSVKKNNNKNTTD